MPAQFEIFYTGLIDPSARSEVIANVAELLQQSPETAEKMVSATNRVVKRGLTQQQADQYFVALSKAGMNVEVWEEGERDTAAQFDHGSSSSPAQQPAPTSEQNAQSDIYSSPKADLINRQESEHGGGSVQAAVDGDIKISVMEILGQSWQAVKGFKLTCHLAFLIYFVVAIAASLVAIPLVFGLTAIGADPSVAGIVSWIIQMAASMVTYIMFIGIHIIGIRHLAGKSISTGTIFRYFGRLPQFLLCYLLVMILVMVGFFLLVIPGIYLLVAYMFAMPLVVEKNMSAWQAMETSRKAITRNWFALFAILFLLILINSLALITLGIAWIWTIPWSVLAMALVHYTLFGAEPETLAE